MSMMIRRLMMLGGVPLPSNVRAYSIVPDEDTFVIEVPHDLGAKPTLAILFDTYENAPSVSSGGTFAGIHYSNGKDNIAYKGIAKVDDSPTAGFYTTTMVDPIVSTTSVTFTKSQYYNITWKANHNLICILLANNPTT